jgi:hypothetical protein
VQDPSCSTDCWMFRITKYKVSHKYSYSSWWWKWRGPKHVKIINKTDEIYWEYCAPICFIYKVIVNLWSNRNSVNRRSRLTKGEQISDSVWPRRLDFLGKRLMFVGLTMDVASCHPSGVCSWKRLLYLQKICGHLLISTCAKILQLLPEALRVPL